MKISKLYCNDIWFKNIIFNLKGVSVIYVDVLLELDEKKNFYDLGKIKLVELIDYLLIKLIDKKNFFLKIIDGSGVLIFKNYIFYFEV